MQHTLLLLALLGCTRDDGDTTDSADTNDTLQDSGDTSEPVDADGDGVTSDLDCNDDDPLVYPGADEQCNEADDDCDGTVDEEVLTRDWFIDADSDGWGDSGAGDAISDCRAPEGRSDRDGDCDDTAPSIHPAAAEKCDGIDDDCDGAIFDDSDLVAPAAALQADICADSVKVCTTEGWTEPDYTQIVGYESQEVSCDGVDNDCSGAVDDLHDSAIVPLADMQLGVCEGTLKACTNGVFAEPDYATVDGFEVDESTCDSLDNDCDGVPDEVDADTDGQRPILCGGDDCDDSNATVGTGFPEDGGSSDFMPTGIDNDCDGFADNGLPYGSGSRGDVVLTGRNNLADLGGESVDVFGSATDSRGQRAYPNGEATIPSSWGPGDEVLLVIDSENFVRGSSDEPDTSRVGEWWIGTIHEIDSGIISFVEEPPDLGVFSAQLTRLVPFNNLTLSAGATLTSTDRAFLYGGVLPLQVAGTLTLGEGATITTEGLGYRGGKGAFPASSSLTTGATGFQGEGRRKILDKLGAGRRSWFQNDFGGGGGGLFMGYDTSGNPTSCQECRCSGGGGGHYLFPDHTPSDYSGDCGDVADGGPNRNPTADQADAIGGLYGGNAVPEPDLLIFGGGGGGGSAPVAQTGVPGDGANGGGAVWVSARSVVFEEGSSISVNGARSEDVYNLYGFAGAQPAWGGSGAGGTLWMRSESTTFPAGDALSSHDYFQAAGGAGNLNFTADPEIWPNFSGPGMAGVITLYTNSFNGEAVQTDAVPTDFEAATSFLSLRRAYPLEEGL